MGKKKIDELFEEQFQGFSEMPDERVWKRLEDSLNKKNSRKAIPLWWKLAGVAAGLLIAFWAINPFENPTENGPTLTDTEQKHEKSPEERPNESTTPFEEKIKNQEGAIVNSDDHTEKNKENGAQEAIEDSFATTKSSGTATSTTNTGKQEKNHFPIAPDATQKGSHVTAADQDGNGTDTRKNKVDFGTQQSSETIANAANNTDGNKNTIPSTQSMDGTTAVAQNDPDYNEKKLLDNTEDSKSISGENTSEGIAQSSEEALEKTADPEKKKKSIFDEIKKQQEEEEAIAESTKGRWSAGPSIAPVFYSAFGEGSPVHSIFVPNSKSGETNLSYGLSVAYEINDKLSVRSGVHRVDYGYGTDDIQFTASLEGSSSGQIDNIDYALNSQSLVVQSKAGQTPQSVTDEMPTQALDVNAVSPARDGTMSQQFGYLEVPLELNYALVDKKFGVNLIGGFSSLFLVDNSVALTSGNETLEMGEANNVNNVNFSTNVGFGVNYNFSSNVRLNIEPVFKYQLSTFSNVDGTFQPFSVGVYSGLSFRF